MPGNFLDRLSDSAEMLLKFSTLLLLVFGILFAAVQLRARLDRGILYFGLFLICLSVIIGVDIWVVPDPEAADSLHYWIRFQHVVGCGLILGMNLYGLWLNRIKSRIYSASVWICTLAEIVLLAGTGMITPAEGGVAYGTLYQVLFVPYFAFFVLVLDGMMVRGLFRASPEERGIFRFQVVGMLILGVCAALDILRNLDPALAVAHSASTFGALGYGFAGVAVFLERVVKLVRDKQAFQDAFRRTKARLAESHGMASLGRSAALVNHEVRNYLATIRGNAILLRNGVRGAQDAEGIARIERSIERIDDITADISYLAKCDWNRDGSPIELREFLLDLINYRFPQSGVRIRLEACGEGIGIVGERKRLEQAFYNILKNAIEAGAGEIRIDVERRPPAIVVRVSDNGGGCSHEQLACLARPFYTSKSMRGGTGLGLLFSRIVVEAHAGSLEFEVNTGTGIEKGLTVVATFPSAA